MADLEITSLQKILHALLLIQLEEIDDEQRFSILVRAGWTNSEIAIALGLSENAAAVRRTRFKQLAKKEKE
jgi:DNA-binding NarL/FixJ family response regulator